MKTETFGGDTYFVAKYYILDDSNEIKVEFSRWSKAEDAFEDCEKHRQKYGYTAFVFKAKQCVKAK